MWDDKWSDPTLLSHLPQEERWSYVCLCVCVCVFLYVCVCLSLYANICVLLGCVLFEYLYMRIWLVWLVPKCVSRVTCVCVSGDGVKECIHSHEVVC